MSDEYLTEEENAILDGVGELEDAGDVEGMRAFVNRHPTIFRKRHDADDRMGVLWHRLYSACLGGDLEMAQLFVELGADMNASLDENSREGVIDYAAGKGNLDLMRWLIDQGAVIQQQRDGRMTSLTLIHSAMTGQPAEVELLLDRGAPVNGLSGNGQTALDFAVTFGHEAVADLLRSRGGLRNWEVRGEQPPPPPVAPGSLREHLAATAGRPDDLSLQEVVPSGAPVVVHRLALNGERYLISDGMAAAAMTPPAGATSSPLAEVYLRLPEGWPLTAAALGDPRLGWPIHWLRRVARMPHEGPFWLDSSGALLSESDPPTPLAPGTRMTTLLATLSGEDWGTWHRPDGGEVRLFLLFPIHPEERELAQREGVRALIEKFDEEGVPLYFDPVRESVV